MNEAEVDFDCDSPRSGNMTREYGDPEIEVTFPDGGTATVVFDEPNLRAAPAGPDDITLTLFRLGSSCRNEDVHTASLKALLIEGLNNADLDADHLNDDAEAVAASLEGLARAIRAHFGRA